MWLDEELLARAEIGALRIDVAETGEKALAIVNEAVLKSMLVTTIYKNESHSRAII